MNKEVKEIIDDIKDFIKDKKQVVCYGKETMEILLNYINSLEQANKNTYETSQDLLSEMQHKIDKAIEYIEYYLRDIDNLDNVMINLRMFKEVLKILKGSDK